MRVHAAQWSNADDLGRKNMIAIAMLLGGAVAAGGGLPKLECRLASMSKVAHQLLDEPLPAASIRVARVSAMMPPGPHSFVMTMESGARLPAPGLPKPVAKAPSFTVVAGDFERVCSVRLTVQECPQLENVMKELKALSIPVGYNYDLPRQTYVYDVSKAVLQASDGDGNDVTWRSSMPGHPLRAAIGDFRDRLRPCLEPLIREFPPYKF